MTELEAGAAAGSRGETVSGSKERVPSQPRLASDELQPRQPLASPEELALLAAAFGKDVAVPASSDQRGWTVSEASHDQIPRLRDITTSAQAWRDNEEDAVTPGRTPGDLGTIFGTRWASRATSAQLKALLALRPRAPRHLEELLRYAERLGVDTWEDEAAKHDIRASFWKAVADAHAPQA